MACLFWDTCKLGRAECAKVAELVDALDLGSSGGTRESSSLSFRTIQSLMQKELLPVNWLGNADSKRAGDWIYFELSLRT